MGGKNTKEHHRTKSYRWYDLHINVNQFKVKESDGKPNQPIPMELCTLQSNVKTIQIHYAITEIPFSTTTQTCVTMKHALFLLFQMLYIFQFLFYIYTFFILFTFDFMETNFNTMAATTNAPTIAANAQTMMMMALMETLAKKIF